MFDHDLWTVLEQAVERSADRYDVVRSGHVDDQKDGFGHGVAIVIAEFVIQVVSRNECKHGVQGIVDLGRAEEPFDAPKGFDDGWLEDQFEDHITKVAEVALISDAIQDVGDLLRGVFMDHAVQGVCENRRRRVVFGFQEDLLQTLVDIVCERLDGSHLLACL